MRPISTFTASKKQVRTTPEQVSNNAGGTEPRFSCNVVINSQSDAYKLVQQLCSVFRAMPFWEAGTSLTEQAVFRLAQIVQKTLPTSSTSQTSPKRVFSYSGSSMKGRPTRCSQVLRYGC